MTSSGSKESDWHRLRAMTDAEATQGALDDSDNPPLSEDQLAAMPRVPFARSIRRALRLTEEEFASRYAIPVAMLREWEQGLSRPDAPAEALLRLIAHEPEMTARVLGTAPKAA